MPKTIYSTGVATIDQAGMEVVISNNATELELDVQLTGSDKGEAQFDIVNPKNGVACVWNSGIDVKYINGDYVNPTPGEHDSITLAPDKTHTVAVAGGELVLIKS